MVPAAREVLAEVGATVSLPFSLRQPTGTNRYVPRIGIAHVHTVASSIYMLVHKDDSPGSDRHPAPAPCPSRSRPPRVPAFAAVASLVCKLARSR